MVIIYRLFIKMHHSLVFSLQSLFSYKTHKNKM